MIPLSRHFITGTELNYISQVLFGGHTSGDGIFTKKCQSLMEEAFGAKRVLLTHSCTAALEMAAMLCNIKSGDEVILPSFTFVSTANAFYIRGAKPIFVDIRKDTLNIDETKIEKAITKRTKVIVPVHYAGVGCEMDTIMDIARQHNLYVVEDAAQGVDAKYKDKYLGTIGDIGTYSFHETKNYTCGEGGAIILNDERFIERAEIVREKGTDRDKFFRGEVDKYTWVDVGSSYLPSDITAAVLYSQLENMDIIGYKREDIFNYYYHNLSSSDNFTLPYIPPECASNNHIFYIILKDKNTRDRLIAYLKSMGIVAVFHYIPLHLSKIGMDLGYKKGQFPITESISNRLLRLPLYNDLTQKDQDYIINCIKKFFSMRME